MPRHVIDPSRTREMRLWVSSQSSRVGAHGDVGSSGGDQHGESMLKLLQSKRGLSGRGSERRCHKSGRLLMT